MNHILTTKTSESPTFKLKIRSGMAYAKSTNEGFVLLKGSQFNKHTFSSCPRNVKKIRSTQLSDLKDNTTDKDILFSSPSAAGAFVTGSSTNGNIAWKTESGQTLKDYETQE